MPRLFKTTLRVRYADTDASGIVYYATYFVYFEVGRIEMFRSLGLPYDRRLPIVETHCRYRAPARFDDELEVHTWVDEVRLRGFRMGQRAMRCGRGGAALLAEGYTAMAHVDEGGRPAPLPKAMRRTLLEAAAAGEEAAP